MPLPASLRVVTFNVNQFSHPDLQAQDLRVRMLNADVLLLQEVVHLDVVAFARNASGWAAFQVRDSNNDGHANTAVLYRTSLGVPTDSECVFVGSAHDTRRRFVTGVEFDGRDWFEAGHIFPGRDQKDVPAELKAIGDGVKAKVAAGKTVTLGFDKNQATLAAIEKATGLTCHFVDIDGFASSLPVAEVAAFKPGFSDHPGVHGVVTLPTPARPAKHRKVAPPNPPYVGPAAHVMHDLAGKPWTDNLTPAVDRIVIHSTVSPTVPGGARSIGRYFATEASGGSAHYIVDPGEAVQDVFDSWVAEHAPPNSNSIGIEMCDIPAPVLAGRAKALVGINRWNQTSHQQMLRRTARLTARLCAAYHVPPVYVNAADLRAGKHGITTHNEVSQAWHETDHWDPGFWPRRRFMRMVRAEYDRLTK